MLDALRDAVGAEHVLTDPDTVGGFTVDWTGRFRGTTPAVVRPADVDEVAHVVAICAGAGAPIVPQGGNTGLVGGSVPLHGEVVLSLQRCAALGEVDAAAGQVTAGAGVTLGALQAHVRAAGWDYGVDLAARDTATVGGMVATNAGGVHVLRYGATRRQVVGIQAVLADGSVIDRLDGLEKDNTGYDLAALFCGSEGTLAVITAARLRCVPAARHVVTVLLAFADVEAALAGVAVLRRDVDALRALEFFEHDGVELLEQALGLGPPFPERHGVYLLAEAAGPEDPTDILAAAVERIAAVRDVAVASNARAEQLWKYRELHTEAINHLGPPIKLDVTLPAANLGAFLIRVRGEVAVVAPDARVWLFGHAADGNVHVNVTGVAPDDDTVTEVVLGLVAAMRGSISAEHGIGTAKRAWVHLTRSAAELRVFRTIKQALDPRGVLNPHVLLPEGDLP